MDTVTRELVRQEKVTRREAREEERQRQLTETQAAWQLERDKHEAVRNVETAAKMAVERLSVKPSKWASQGTVERVCNWTGPHHGFWCLFHWRKRVTLVRIHVAHGSCRRCFRTSSNQSSYMREQHFGLYLGSDGNLYRYGHTKIFRAKLMDRHNARHIRALIPKLDAME